MPLLSVSSACAPSILGLCALRPSSRHESIRRNKLLMPNAGTNATLLPATSSTLPVLFPLNDLCHLPIDTVNSANSNSKLNYLMKSNWIIICLMII